MSNDDTSTQAAQAGDASSEATSGYVAVPVVPREEHAVAVEQNKEAKKQRISQAEWQENAEKAKEGEEVKAALKQELGVESTEDIAKIRTELELLKEENRRKDWEVEHPVVRSDKYEEDWKRVNREKRYAELTFDERWALINREKSVSKDVKNDFQMSSVPIASRSSVVTSGIDPETAAMGAMMGYTEEDYRKAGIVV